MKNRLGVDWSRSVPSPKSFFSFDIRPHISILRDNEKEADALLADQWTDTTDFDGNEIFRQMENLIITSSRFEKIKYDAIDAYFSGQKIYYDHFFSKKIFSDTLKSVASDYVYYPLEYFNAFGKNMGFPLNSSKLEIYRDFSVCDYRIEHWDYLSDRIPPVYLIFSRVQPRRKEVKSVNYSVRPGYMTFEVSEDKKYPCAGKTRVVAGSQMIRNRMLGPIQHGMKALMKSSIIHNSSPPYSKKFSHLSKKGYKTISMDITKCDENNNVMLQLENIKFIIKLMNGIIDHPEVNNVLKRGVEAFESYYKGINLFRFGKNLYFYKSNSLRSGDLLTTPHNAMSVTFCLLGYIERAGLLPKLLSGAFYLFNYGDDTIIYYDPSQIDRDSIIRALNNENSPFLMDVSEIESFLMRDPVNFKTFLTRAMIMTNFLEREKTPLMQKYALYARASELDDAKRSTFSSLMYSIFGRENLDFSVLELDELKKSLRGYDSFALEDLMTLGFKMGLGEEIDFSVINEKMTAFRKKLSQTKRDVKDVIDVAASFYQDSFV
jgi:hypothetical protein